ncbi:STAS domain-containing protein [candidate division KSB1 bacterium]|nr:STAS domain-containing protein [candidate division KSB1 bacterium]
MEGIQLSVKQTGANNDISIIKVGGYIDTTTSAELEHSLESLLKNNNYNIIIDLGNVDYISSAGWGIFISELKGIRDRGGDLKLVNMMPDVFEVFELLEFHYILKAFDSIEEAIADFGRRKFADHEKAPYGKAVTEDYDSSRDSSYDTSYDTSDEESEAEDVSHTADKLPRRPGHSIDDKIKKMVIESPDISSIKILKKLKSARYGNEKINYFQLLKHLRKLNLNSRKKRLEYVQSLKN